MPIATTVITHETASEMVSIVIMRSADVDIRTQMDRPLGQLMTPLTLIGVLYEILGDAEDIDIEDEKWHDASATDLVNVLSKTRELSS